MHPKSREGDWNDRLYKVVFSLLPIEHIPIMKHFLFVILSVLLVSVTNGQSLRTVQRIEGIPDRVEYRALTHDPSGNLYVATSADVFMIPNGSNQAQPMKVGDQIMDVDWSQEFGLIMLHKSGIIRFVATGKELTLDAGGEATCMDLTRNIIWVGTKNGVHLVSIPQEKVIEHFTTAQGVLINNQINFLHTDPFGVRWVGTEAGVARIKDEKWKLYEDKHSFRAITSTSEGAWLAANDEMWLVNSFNRWFPIDAWKDLVDGPVKALSSDPKGIIFIASNSLVKYDPFQEKVLSMNEGGVTEETVLLDRGPGNNVWMAGHNGLSRVIEDTTKVLAPAPPGAPLAVLVKQTTNPVCPGTKTGKLMVEVQGGEAPYTYAWSDNSSKNAEATDLAPGVYQVTVTDNANKTILGSGIVTAATEIKASASQVTKASNLLEKDGKAKAVAQGGTAPFTYKWSNGEQMADAIKLNEGQHSVTITDNFGCIATASVEMQSEKVLKSLDIATIQPGQKITLEKLYFQADSAMIENTSLATLAELYDFLKGNPSVVVEIGGHTNSLPEDAYCDKLSTARAKNVADYLYQNGIPQGQVSFKGYGKRDPIATNQTVEGRRRNQRVEVKVVSM